MGPSCTRPTTTHPTTGIRRTAGASGFAISVTGWTPPRTKVGVIAKAAAEVAERLEADDLVAFTPDEASQRQMALQADRLLLECGWCQQGDTVVIVAESPPGIPGSTNALQVHRIGDAVGTKARAYQTLPADTRWLAFGAELSSSAKEPGRCCQPRTPSVCAHSSSVAVSASGSWVVGEWTRWSADKPAPLRELDVHVIDIAADGKIVRCYEEPRTWPESIDATGSISIAGTELRCVSKATQLAMHTDYAMPDQHLRDLEVLGAG